jgi:hypothetical protein
VGNRIYLAAPLAPLNSADGTAVTATSLTDASPAPQKVVQPDWLELGTILRLRARGEYTCGSTATNLTIGFYWGGAAGAVSICGVAGQALTVSQTAVPWWLEFEGEIRSLGASGSIKGSGYLDLATSLTASTRLPVPTTAAARITTIDTTTRKILTVAGNVSQTVGAPAFTCYGLTAEILG